MRLLFHIAEGDPTNWRWWRRDLNSEVFEKAATEPVLITKKGNSLTGNREWGMGNKKGRMPIPFDGDKEKKYIRHVAQPIAKR